MIPVDLAIDALAIAALLAFLPYAIFQTVLIVRNRRLCTQSMPTPAAPRPLVAVIATNGRAVDVVNRIIETIRSYRLGVLVLVLIEEGDRGRYRARRLVVPASYRTPNGSTFKCRALHYYSERLRQIHGSFNTLHLDDDSIPTRPYVAHAMGLRTDAGQGLIRLRGSGTPWINRIADLVRIVDCDTYCAWANSRGRPVHVHGEGLVLRSEVEARLGWDFGDRKADDYLMGQRLRAEGFTFSHIPAFIRIAPPVSVAGFFKQRRRWFAFFHRSVRQSWRLNPWVTAWLLCREVSTPMTMVGVALWIYVVAERIPLPPSVAIASMANLLLAEVVGQYGGFRAGRIRDMVLGALLIVPSAVYQSATWFYAVVASPRSFDTVVKV